MSRQPQCLFPGHCGSVKQDNKRYFILYLQLASCVARHNEGERIKPNCEKHSLSARSNNEQGRKAMQPCNHNVAKVSSSSSCRICLGLTFIKSVSLLSSGMPDIQWMNLDPVKLMEELSQFTSLEGFKEMLDKAQVGGTNTHSQI